MTYLFVYNDVHFDTGFSPAFKNSVEPVIFIKFAWPPKIYLWRQPPILRNRSYVAKLHRGVVEKVHTMMKITSLALSNISDSAQR